jgi:hypothetical protein
VCNNALTRADIQREHRDPITRGRQLSTLRSPHATVSCDVAHLSVESIAVAENGVGTPIEVGIPLAEFG